MNEDDKAEALVSILNQAAVHIDANDPKAALQLIRQATMQFDLLFSSNRPEPSGDGAVSRT